MKTAVITFPGSNCDKDIGDALFEHYNHSVSYIWHKDTFGKEFDLVVLPGGFSYGDYLRCGAMARFANSMNSVIEHSKSGRLILGICNGFQILTECSLLPGALTRNKSLKHICKTVSLVKGGKNNPLTKKIQENEILQIPISHGEGAYFADENTLKKLEDQDRILLKYAIENPNGSLNNIAGITSENFKIAGLMPHPERALDDINQSTDGKKFFDSFFGL
ncbi:MAG: phosphoribosylformylglycinamidine synthase subunit PurQ [Leptospiraceae bacterium]|nr:phosphoribosylformylglycinamidine synthase subunit PurQ [Leptospiraceae bacterium]MCK6380500.1 phosphoribosylformylglycinamidine synthase subunit PurQ [Leptospiraceae bacterium]NUM42195.1 phosphoribosylformylglycinamidine synthase subunit PurQ [Leptospiraceae bacterium]